jgi:prepilin-type N-terminal cleavage/methylation domain-containing protein
MRARALRHGFTLIEILIAIAVICVLSAIVFTVSKKAIDSSHMAKCAGNLRGIFVSLGAYAADNNGAYPQGIPVGKNDNNPTYRNPTLLLAALEPYVDDRRIFYCPSDKRDAAGKIPNTYNETRWKNGDFSYFYVHRSASDATQPRRIVDQSKAIIMTDYFKNDSINPVARAHRSALNVMQLDGSVRKVPNGENIQALMTIND